MGIPAPEASLSAHVSASRSQYLPLAQSSSTQQPLVSGTQCVLVHVRLAHCWPLEQVLPSLDTHIDVIVSHSPV